MIQTITIKNYIKYTGEQTFEVVLTWLNANGFSVEYDSREDVVKAFKNETNTDNTTA